MSISRRRFLVLAGMATSVGLLEACAPAAAPAPTSAPAAPAATSAPAAQPTKPAAAATQAPAASSAPAGAAPSPKQTFIYALSSDPDNLDPAVSTSGQASVCASRCYDRLVLIKPGTPQPGAPLEVIPDLAESWQTSADGLTYTFKLRKGLKFADGSPLDAKAVKWSFDRCMAVNKGSSAEIRQLKTTEAVDDVTVKMTLSEVNAYFLPTLAGWQFGVVNPKVGDQQKDNDWGQAYLASNIMGSGPYKLTEWKRGEKVTLDYNPNWYGKEPAIKRVIISIIPETTNHVLQLQKGDIDFTANPSIPETAPLVGKPGVVVKEAPAVRLILAYLNCQKPPFDNVKVRQAAAWAINYDSLIKDVIMGHGRRLRGPITYLMEGYDESLKGYDYNPQKAKDLMKEAGFPNGVDVTLTYSSQGATGADDVALAAQADLTAVGIKVKIEKVAEPTRRERIDRGDFQWSIGSWICDPIPSQTLYRWCYSKLAGLNVNRAWYNNPKVDDLVLKAPTVFDPQQRIALWRQAQNLVVEDSPYLLFYQANDYLPIRDNVEGFDFMPNGSQYLYYERLSKK